MKVILLGGHGHYGGYIGRKLAARAVVTEIVVAGRSSERAAAFAEQLGPKARAGQIDLLDGAGLPDFARGADLVVNTTGPDHVTAIPALRLAIAIGAHYCDLNVSWQATERALAMSDDARRKGVTAITGMGAFPGLFSLLAMHGAAQLDKVEAVRVGYCMSVQALVGDPTAEDREIRVGGGGLASGFAAVIHGFSGTVRQFSGGKFVDVDAMSGPFKLPLVGGGQIEVYRQGSPEPVTLPHSIPGVQEVTMGAGLYPPQVNGLIEHHIKTCSTGNLDDIADAIWRDLCKDPQRWTAVERDDVTKGEAVVVEGFKGGRRIRCLVEPNWNGEAFEADPSGDVVTGGPLLVGALKILSGEFVERGVFSPEQCFSPEPFFEDLRREVNLFQQRGGNLVTVEFQEVSEW
jgi:saccharopine dehydrogenase-like NADP-dependent oxidoreductase